MEGATKLIEAFFGYVTTFEGKMLYKRENKKIIMYGYSDCPENCLFKQEPGCMNCDNCSYCGDYLYERGSKSRIHFDHIKAKSVGGKTIAPACHGCNLSKKDKGLKEWLRWLIDNDPQRWRQIVENNKWKTNRIAQTVREIRDYG